MKTANCALLTPDVIFDAATLFESPQTITPVEIHALNSLIEAIVLHETAYVYCMPTNKAAPEMCRELFNDGVLHAFTSGREFEEELESRGLGTTAGNVLEDRTFGNSVVAYSPTSAADILSTLINYEKTLGFSRMSSLNERTAFLLGRLVGFAEDDIILLDDSFRKTRATATCATELNLELYTGIVSRAFALGHFNARRRGALQLFEQLKVHFEDVEDTELPQWRRIQIPALTQTVLKNCRGSARSMPEEILNLREQLKVFRATLTNHALQLESAKSRGDKRKVRRETQRAWDALLEKHDKTTRLTHQLWDIAKEPLKAHIKIGDKLLERDKLDQAVLKVEGLTDLWHVLSDAPTIEQNVKLLGQSIGVECDHAYWHKIGGLARQLELLMQMNTEPALPKG